MFPTFIITLIALISHLLTLLNRTLMFSNGFNKIFNYNEYSHDLEIFKIALFYYIIDRPGNLS